jgi:lysosomal acid lipase/cholesteryl ester hydrolase
MMGTNNKQRRGKAAATAAAILCLLLAASDGRAGIRHAQARSILNTIPGAGMVRELADELVGRLGETLDNTILRPVNEHLVGCLAGAGGACMERDPDADRSVVEIIRSRGFEAEEHHVTTRDGYILTVQRIINPLVSAEQRAKLKPVILQHGLMSSSVDWVINSVHVKPAKWPRDRSADNSSATGTGTTGTTGTTSTTSTTTTTTTGGLDDIADNDIGLLDELLGDGADDNSIEAHQRRQYDRQDGRLDLLGDEDSQEHPRALGFYLANEGYDVFLANSRGNIYGQRHVKMSSWNPKFWSFTFDEQIKYDLPDTASYIQQLTGHTKLGYVGHSQGTTMMFGLLADQPDYADVFEPIVMLAPVAYTANVVSPVKYFAVYTPLFQHVNMWFASSNVAVRYLAPLVCKPDMIKHEICANIFFLSCGFDEDELDIDRFSAYAGHMPSGTSVKNIAHWGQMVLSGRFAHFDHGILGNQAEYGQMRAPDYQLAKIRSKSLVLFTADNDWLASPKDVAKLRAELRVAPLAVHNITEDQPKWNHIDFVYGKHCGLFVNKRIVEAFHQFD